METKNISFRELGAAEIDLILVLAMQLNPKKTADELTGFLKQMFAFENYHCFGLFTDARLVAVSSGWITVRFYSDKQLEIDNVVVDDEIRSAGFGKILLENIEAWARENSCKTIELNTYVQNSRSHKFYFNNGYSIIGYHFQKNS